MPPANTDKENRLIRELRRLGILPPRAPVQIIHTRNPRNQEWRWYARNPNNGVSYRVGSHHAVTLLTESVIGTRTDSRGTTITILRGKPAPGPSRASLLRAYRCDECGAEPGQFCLVRGVPKPGTIHMSRIRKYGRDHPS